jgi:micrococcal nuclease
LVRRLRLSVFVILGVAGFVAASSVTGVSGAADVTKTAAFVRKVVDGDTVVVSYGGHSDKVRILGIDSPEKGRCYASQATAETKRLAGGKYVKLVRDGSQAARDRYGRILAYVIAPTGDVGLALVRGGFAKVYVFDSTPFARTASYRRAENAAKASSRGLWASCGESTGAITPAGTTSTASTTTTSAPRTTTVSTTTNTTTGQTTMAATTTTVITATTTPTTTATTTTPSKCDPSYPTVCIPPPPPDLDCGDISYRDFKVVPPDPHRFDGDHDGIGCES